MILLHLPWQVFRRDHLSSKTLHIAMLLALQLILPLLTLSTTKSSVVVASTLATDPRGQSLVFVPNVGQINSNVHFQVRSKGTTFFFTRYGGVFGLPLTSDQELQVVKKEVSSTNSQQWAIAQLNYEGTDSAMRIVPKTPLKGTVNYLIGNSPDRWFTEIPTYSGIIYQQLYPGIDLHYNGKEGLLKSTYIVAPGANPNQIRWHYQDAMDVRVDDSTDDLVITIPLPAIGGKLDSYVLTENAPVAWQIIDGQKVPVTVQYKIAPDKSIGFVLGEYDSTERLIIDPALIYSTYLGGTGSDIGQDITVDTAGNTYMVGWTESSDFPHKNPLQSNFSGNFDVYVAKMNASGSALNYATYLGGSGDDRGMDIAVDNRGNVYLTGETLSPDFPTMNPLQPDFGGARDAFVVKLNPTGSALIYSTYLGGSGPDAGSGVIVDNEQNVYVTGSTPSTNFQLVNPLQPAHGGGRDAFVAQLNAAGSELVYATYIGGSKEDRAFGIAVDTIGNFLQFVYRGDEDRLLDHVLVNHPRRRVQFDYDTQGRIIAIVDYMQRIWRYTYDDLGDLIGVTTPATDRYLEGLTTCYEYSSTFTTGLLQHNLTRIIDAEGQLYLENEYGESPGQLNFNRIVRQRQGGRGIQL